MKEAAASLEWRSERSYGQAGMKFKRRSFPDKQGLKIGLSRFGAGRFRDLGEMI